MNEIAFLKKVRKFNSELPHFPDRRINYANAKEAAVVVVFVKFKDEFLLLKRSDKVRTYKGKWQCVAGYFDEVKPVRAKAFEELREEVGLDHAMVSAVIVGEAFKQTDKELGITWIVSPVLVELKKKPEIKTDWESSNYKWVHPTGFRDLDTVPNFSTAFKKLRAV